MDTKAALLAQRAEDETDTVMLGTVPVLVRGLNRAQVTKAQEFEDTDAGDRLIVSMALVDPVLTPAEVAAWFESAPAGYSVKLLERIAELSALREGARKSDHQEAE